MSGPTSAAAAGSSDEAAPRRRRRARAGTARADAQAKRKISSIDARTSALINLSMTIEQASEQVLPATYLFLGRSLRASPSQLGLLTLSRAMVQTLASPLSGLLGTFFDRARVLSAGALLWGVMTAALAGATSLRQACAFAALNGAGLALLVPCACSLTADLFPAAARGRAFGVMALTGALGGMLGGLFATNVGAKGDVAVPWPLYALARAVLGRAAPGRPPGTVEGWRLAYLAVALVSVSVGLLVLAYARDPRPGMGGGRGGGGGVGVGGSFLFVGGGGGGGGGHDSGRHRDGNRSGGSLEEGGGKHGDAGGWEDPPREGDEGQRLGIVVVPGAASGAGPAPPPGLGSSPPQPPASFAAPLLPGPASTPSSSSAADSSAGNSPCAAAKQRRAAAAASAAAALPTRPPALPRSASPPRRRHAQQSHPQPREHHDLTSCPAAAPVAAPAAGSAAAGSAAAAARRRRLASDVARVLRIPTFQVIVAQGVVGSFPWQALVFLLLWFQLLGFGDLAASSLIAVFQLGVALGGLLGGVVADRAARAFPSRGRVAVAQISVAAGLPLVFVLFRALPAMSDAAAAAAAQAAAAAAQAAAGAAAAQGGAAAEAAAQAAAAAAAAAASAPPAALPYALCLALLGLLCSWCGAGVNSPIFAELVPDDLRSFIFSMDRSLEMALAACAAPVVGYVAERRYGFSGKLSDDAAMNDPLVRRGDARALASSLLLCTALPWAACLAFYTALYGTYPRDRRAARQWAEERGAALARLDGEGGGRRAGGGREEEWEEEDEEDEEDERRRLLRLPTSAASPG